MNNNEPKPIRPLFDAVIERNKVACRKMEGWFRDIAARLEKEDLQAGIDSRPSNRRMR